MTETSHKQWYCLKAKTKREHIAAAILKSRGDLNVFCPRVSLIKNTVRGPRPFTEALFPGYIFCQFSYEESSRLVSFSQDIIGIVKFGDKIPAIPDACLAQLQAAFPEETIELKPVPIKEGELVEIICGCFEGESGTVTQISDGTNRVNLLIEFLGNQVQIELPSHHLISRQPVTPGASLGLQANSNH